MREDKREVIFLVNQISIQWQEVKWSWLIPKDLKIQMLNFMSDVNDKRKNQEKWVSLYFSKAGRGTQLGKGLHSLNGFSIHFETLTPLSRKYCIWHWDVATKYQFKSFSLIFLIVKVYWKVFNLRCSLMSCLTTTRTLNRLVITDVIYHICMWLTLCLYMVCFGKI